MTYIYEKGLFHIDDGEVTFREAILNEEYSESRRTDGSLITKMAVRGPLLHGPSRTYYANGTVAAEKWFVSGHAHGKSTAFSQSGAMLSEKRYLDGMLTGNFRRWREDGSLLFSASFVKGVLNGTVELYHCDGYLLRSTEFSHGRRHGVDYSWTDDGYLIFCEIWSKGQCTKTIMEDIFLKSLMPHPSLKRQ